MMRLWFWGLSSLVSMSGWADSLPKVDMNRADTAQLDAMLEGVGARKAQVIVDWRNQHGAFHSVEDVAKIKGMARLAERNRDRMVFATETSRQHNTSRQIDDHTLLIPWRR
jgi:competence protein ComEA